MGQKFSVLRLRRCSLRCGPLRPRAAAFLFLDGPCVTAEFPNPRRRTTMNPAKSTIGKFRKSLVLVPVLMLVTALGFAAAQAPVWHSGDRWGTYYSGGYRLANDVWGRGPGPQIIWANSATNWGVWADHPTTAGDKSYPN